MNGRLDPARWLPAARRDSVAAARAEADAAEDPQQAARWRRSATVLLIRGLLAGPVVNLLVLVLVIAALVWLNSSSSDVASQASLLCILLGAGLTGFVWRSRVWIGGVAIGATVAVQHVVSLALRLPEPHLALPPGWFSTSSLLVLIIPAMIAAYAGASIRKLSRPRGLPDRS